MIITYVKIVVTFGVYAVNEKMLKLHDLHMNIRWIGSPGASASQLVQCGGRY